MFGRSGPVEKEQTVVTGANNRDQDRRIPAKPVNARVQHSILSADMTLTGDLIGRGDVTVEGCVDGNIKCRSLTLSGQPTISGSVEAEAVHLCGTFNGELRARKVVIARTAKMRGDVYHETLEVHPSATFEGRVKPLGPGRSL